MRIIDIDTPGGPDNLVIREVPTPEPGRYEVLIRVRGIGVNRADLLQRQGHYPPPAGAPAWPGLEVSGTVAALGADVTTFQLDQPVMALLAGGGYAEYVSVPATQVMAVPAGVDLLEAAGLPEALATVWSMIFGCDSIQPAAGLRSGESILIHGGAGGIGTVAIQMAKLAGAKVAVTVGTEAGAELCSSLGADLVINYQDQDFTEVLREAWGGVDVILDIIGAAYLEKNLRTLNFGGRLAIIGMQKGTKAEMNLGRLLPRRLSVFGATLRARPDGEKAKIMASVAGYAEQIERKQLVPVIDRIFDFTEAGAAHQHVEASGMLGKVLLSAQNPAQP